MPELPEVEVVRRGLDTHVRGRRFASVDCLHPRAIRGLEGGEDQLKVLLVGQEVISLQRRGKFLWLVLGKGDSASQSEVLGDGECLLVHLGMSGQMLIKDAAADADDPNFRHLRMRARLDDGQQLWFVDQRTFGYWLPCELVQIATGVVPRTVTHIARDLLDPQLCLSTLARGIKAQRGEIKKVLLNQEIVAGIGNIYADEMLFAATLHPRQPAHRISEKRLVELLRHGQDVMLRALEQGGTSFDELYVNVNGQSGYFDLSLHAYGQHGRGCDRCGEILVREKFGNRSSHFCPACQRLY
ncbi:bifunctional DNA-formamidopyrimidine glycosylase/DNA-(apurinic or apyrimidinic site) lyase [Corynebacterium felinum]|uniref:Formamidopyrimidine-DNA glycosylase n=1 Tax=Corynebacterium felinum TaxID=131318 RepID=A0ABU2BBS6_9CORY|nr:bifunctional DNA-formamidopyrimidine glycosylase/DNA-(apurinic or apyrimidinic site) lyase [Corynebacterium felinum]MDF5819811.1 bifunctional DNA-formamidopyrimidine glycosylase/DNA-(apurinic or apyrimidinic site) lyase [Corynebacterium felinum]MDR7356048.1 formamidopyrimidine-DNA glycosylase [Corynebacterium felinum]WJY95383.1 Formamidopyrimidine-DNA glycosylase 1 [Corynebacterium felinum]